MNSNSCRILTLALVALTVCACSDDNEVADQECGIDYNLPADIPGQLSNATQSTFDEYSWQSFLALNAPEVGGQIALDGDNVTQTSGWSSTVDLLKCNLNSDDCVCPGDDCRNPGSHYYPAECQSIPNFDRYRVLSGIDKADDSFIEATIGGLGNEPLLDANGRFIRYEILVAPGTYRHVADNGFYDWPTLTARTSDLLLPCGLADYTGGDPANPEMGTMVVKNAWMDGGLPDARYHQEPILIFNPGYRSTDGQATCELRTMSLVGLHIGHKTLKQPSWLWSTFEHVLNAPDCAGLPPPGQQQPLVNTACPSNRTQDYNFAPSQCDNGSCAPCNVAPASNAPTGSCLIPGATDTTDGWCLNLPPNPSQGISQLCTQVPVADNYPDAHRWNELCQAALGSESVWSQYKLISTQNYDFDTEPTTCRNVVVETSTPESRTKQRPQVDIPADPGDSGNMVATRPWLGNTSMESYERSNCAACHTKARIQSDAGRRLNTDHLYFLAFETCAGWCAENEITPCSCLN